MARRCVRCSAGAALTGAACLSTVLLCTQVAGNVRRADWIAVLGGRFHAPIGFVIAGFGAFGFLLFGVFDQWWHTVFGFDAVLSSPPHVGLILSDVMSTVGCALIFASGRTPRVPETVVAVAVALGFSLPFIMATASELGWIIPLLALPALLLPLGMAFGASITRRPWAALWVMLAFTAFRWLFWWLFPMLTKAYADSLGYGLRDTTDGIPQIPSIMPVLAPVAGLLMGALLAFGKARGWRVGPLVLIGGALGGITIYLDSSLINVVHNWYLLIVAGLIGAAGAWLGWQLGVVMRHVNPAIDTRTEVRA